MIAKAPKAGRYGTNTAGLLRYLFGPGRANEHVDPHVVAASDPEWIRGGALAPLVGQRGGIARLARQVDRNMTGHQITPRGGHVYHVVLSVPKQDGSLGDQWRELVEDAVQDMGFGADADGVGGCEYAAVHHGPSKQGHDHVHVVINRVTGDGRIVNTYRDWPRWRQWCLDVEQRHNLSRTASAGAGRTATSRAELERATRNGRGTERQRLTRLVEDAVVEADSELDFLVLLTGKKVLFAPRVSASGTVEGYKVALEPDDGAAPFWLSGSKLRRSLSLPRLRARWGSTPTVPAYVWRHGLAIDPSSGTTRTANWQQVAHLLRQANTEIGTAAAPDPAAWHAFAGQAADFATVLLRTGDPSGRLRRAQDHLARAAQPPRGLPPARHNSALPALARATRLAARSSDPTAAVVAVLMLLLVAIVEALRRHAGRHDVHDASRQRSNQAYFHLSAHPVVRTARPSPSSPPPAKQPTTGAKPIRRPRRPRPGPPPRRGRGLTR